MIEMKDSMHTRGRKKLTKTTAQQYAVCHIQPRRGNIENQTNFNDGDVEGNYHPQTRIQGSGRQWPAASRETNPFEALNDDEGSLSAAKPLSAQRSEDRNRGIAGGCLGGYPDGIMGNWVFTI